MAKGSISPRAYRRITLLAAVALGVIIVSGAAVRLTGSGLGCPDWPTCYQSQFHPEYRYHPMVEFTNRMFTGVVSFAVIAAVLGSLVRAPRRPDLTRWSLGLVAGVVAQIVLGGITVLTHLTPPVVAAHFLLSMVLMWNAVVLHLRAGEPDGATTVAAPVNLRRLADVMLALAGAVLVTGTVVTGTGPHGGDENVKRLDLSLTWVARVHSTIVWLLVAATLLYAYRTRTRSERDKTRTVAYPLVWAIGAQGIIGYVQYAAGVPSGLVIFHIAGSVAVFVSVVRLHVQVHREPGSPASTVFRPSYDHAPEVV